MLCSGFLFNITIMEEEIIRNKGKFVKGVVNNPEGRKKGSKDKFPRRYPPEVLAKIEELIGMGYPQVKIAEALGIKKAALTMAKQRNPEVRAVFVRARTKFIEHHLKNIGQFAHEKDWRASKYLLEIYDPESFSERRRLELAGKDGKALKFEIVSYSQKQKK